MKILIAVPCSSTIEPEVFKAIYNIRSAEHELHFDFIRGYDCAVARNEIVKLSFQGMYDYVLMIDSDTIVPANVLGVMLDPPADIVLGVCPRKNTKDGKTAIIKLDAPEYHDNYYYNDLPEGRTLVKGGGFACALVRTSVFTILQDPWFQYVTNEDGSTLSEDYYFCQNARFMGFDIYMDPRVRCGHLVRYYQYE